MTIAATGVAMGAGAATGASLLTALAATLARGMSLSCSYRYAVI